MEQSSDDSYCCISGISFYISEKQIGNLAMNGKLTELGAHIKERAQDRLTAWSVNYGQLNLQTDCDSLLWLVRLLRDDAHCRFVNLVDICGVDWPARPERFDVVYHFLSPYLNQRVRLKIMVDINSSVPSIGDIFPASHWFEREAYDMYGILFHQHPDMRRLLTDYEFSGFPLRKDFPLTGYMEVRYDDEQKQVIYEPVRLNQAFRDFDFLSPWEDPATILPGDEKAGSH